MKKQFNAILCVSMAAVSCSVAEREKKLPNIIFILADDLGYGDLSCYGQSKFSTPNIDRLSQEGMMFTQHYTGCTVSSPSRSSLLTGLHTGHTFVRGNGDGPLPDSAYIIPEMLKSRGYVTGVFGKWGLGSTNDEGAPNNQGVDEFFGYTSNGPAHNYYPESLWHNREKVLLHENDSGKTGAYSTDIMHSKAIEFIEKNKANRFFLFYTTIIPHAELFAKPEYHARFRGRFEPEKSFVGVDSGPKFRRGAYGSQPEGHAAFAGMVTELDDYVGEIMAELKELGLEENTIVMFASDNGPHIEGGADPDYFDSNGPLKGYKRDFYEGGIRTPLLVKWPGKVKSGSRSDHVSAFWDIMPTLAEVTGAEMKSETDGISFLPELLGKKSQKQHEFLYWELHERGGKMAVRMGDWKLVKRDLHQPQPLKPELYDLSADLGEENDVAGAHPEVVKKMEEIIDREHTYTDHFPFTFENN